MGYFIADLMQLKNEFPQTCMLFPLPYRAKIDVFRAQN